MIETGALVTSPSISYVICCSTNALSVVIATSVPFSCSLVIAASFTSARTHCIFDWTHTMNNAVPPVFSQDHTGAASVVSCTVRVHESEQ